ncbi:MAG: AAA family ATPase, partial [Actinomycetota bacterium]|nr:AAA family ATPase [Actinomycetota bacterium]
MLLTRISLRNYRVFEAPLDLELPGGLVGIFGPNGAGKSVLIESVRFAVYGRSQSTQGDVRTSGVLGDCVAEVEFEHEGHLYSVRRTLTGLNATAKADATADGAQVAEGVRDVAQYVQSVLGVDDAAFRASVFAEQNQLASFSAQAPDKRRELVLRLLGVTPLDRARDDARRDARSSASDHDRLRGLLPDLEGLVASVTLATAKVDEASGASSLATASSEQADERLRRAEVDFERIDEQRRAHDELVSEGRSVKAELVAAEEESVRLAAELADLATAE